MNLTEKLMLSVTASALLLMTGGCGSDCTNGRDKNGNPCSNGSGTYHGGYYGGGYTRPVTGGDDRSSGFGGDDGGRGGGGGHGGSD